MNHPRSSRPWVIKLSGIATLVLGVGALLLPLVKRWPGGAVVGLLLLLAGVFELLAGASRASVAARRSAALAGGLTLLAGLLFMLEIFVPYVTANYIVIGWLLLSGALLLYMSGRSTSPTPALVGFGGLADIVIGFILIIGLPVSALVIALFGPTPEVVASFALVLAASFFVTGLVLLLVARAEAGLRNG